MIKREDFAASDAESSSFENVSTISLRDFTKGGLIGPSLRKPDFQRETNHWGPDQVVSLLECFVNGDLIPSVILWQSPTYLFVIDGGHRLSALKAWIDDDYGDGPTSQPFFGYQISDEQKKNAEKVRALVAKKIGSWQHYLAKAEDENLDTSERKKLNALITRGLPIQWVKGDADKAESSFFKINTKGTPLDDIEELLLKSRKKPISIAARAIIRAGKGHRYWSSFDRDSASKIEELAKGLHSVLFDPEIKRPIKTLDLPLGGPKGVRTALQALIDLSLIATRNQQGLPKGIYDTADDVDGTETIAVLTKTLALAKRVTGNDGGSLGLHPAVYFYGPTGRHSGPMFMGTMTLVGRKLSNNDKTFFQKFTSVRSKLEDVLINHKDLIATILQKHVSTKRVDKYADFLDELIRYLATNEIPSERELVNMSGLDGKVVVGSATDISKEFSDDIKSSAFINAALSSSIKCPLCSGYLDTEKSVSYDHVVRAREGGLGHSANCHLTHPYCNQAVKN
jgi:transcription termination factor NusB